MIARVVKSNSNAAVSHASDCKDLAGLEDDCEDSADCKSGCIDCKSSESNCNVSAICESDCNDQESCTGNPNIPESLKRQSQWFNKSQKHRNDAALSWQMILWVTLLLLAQSYHNATLPWVACSNHEDKNASHCDSNCHKLCPAMSLADVLEFDKEPTINLFYFHESKVDPANHVHFPELEKDRKLMKINCTEGKFPQSFRILPQTPLTAISETTCEFFVSSTLLVGAHPPLQPCHKLKLLCLFWPMAQTSLLIDVHCQQEQTITISWVQL